MKSLIKMKEIAKVYDSRENRVKALDKINIDIDRGEMVAIVGQSGSGKTTLMSILGFLDTASSGNYYFNGKEVSSIKERQLSFLRNHYIGFIFQSFNLIPTLTAVENVELPLMYRQISKKERHIMAKNALELVGLSTRMNHKPAQLSGGQQQRVAIARAIAGSPHVILADEPTGNLDSASGSDIVRILHNLHRQGKTIILITHDQTLASQTQRQITISDGKII